MSDNKGNMPAGTCTYHLIPIQTPIHKIKEKEQ